MLGLLPMAKQPDALEIPAVDVPSRLSSILSFRKAWNQTLQQPSKQEN